MYKKRNMLSKLIFSFIMAIVFLSLSAMSAFAAVTNEQIISTEVIQLDNGDCLTIETKKIASLTRASNVSLSQEARYSRNGKLMASFTVIGTFRVNYGVSVQCIGTDTRSYVSSGSWKVEDITVTPNNSNPSLASVRGTASIVERFLGITLDRENVIVNVTCDKNGN